MADSELRNLLRDLVRIESPYFQERAATEYAAAWLEQCGVPVERHRFYAAAADFHGENLCGVIEGARPGPRIHLNGHLDTVRLCRGWTRPPYGGEIDGDRLYGVGALDMTMMHTYAADIWKYVEDVAVYDALDRAGLLPLRVTVYLDKLEKLEGHQPFTTDAQRADPKHKTQLGGYKLFCDGSLGSRSAALYEPYADDPGTSGIVVEDLEALERKMLRAAREGIQSATHAIGDRALDLVVTAVEHTVAELRKDGWSEEKIAQHPFRIIHAQLASDELIARMNPMISLLHDKGLIDAVAYEQTRVFEAATAFARCEGTLPAPESSHAIRAAVDEALRCKQTGEHKVILFGLTGTGYFDLAAYSAYHNGTMTDYIPTDADLEKGFASIPKL